MNKEIIAALFALSLAACATGPQPQERAERGPRPPSLDQAGRVLAVARNIKTKQGCAAAAPAYRATAALGEGFEVAQSELGACLLEMSGKNAAETTLFRQEAEFWLTRAAYAGEGRAQKKLAEYYGDADTAHADPQKAVQWALVYENNGQAELFNYKPLPIKLISNAKSQLTEAQLTAAEAFAAEFSTIHLTQYSAPNSRIRQNRPPGGQSPQGQRPRRR